MYVICCINKNFQLLLLILVDYPTIWRANGFEWLLFLVQLYMVKLSIEKTKRTKLNFKKKRNMFSPILSVCKFWLNLFWYCYISLLYLDCFYILHKYFLILELSSWIDLKLYNNILRHVHYICNSILTSVSELFDI